MSETWLSANVSNENIFIENYVLFRKDRDSRGGGIAVFIKKSLNYKIIDSNNIIEQLWFSVKIKCSTYIFGTIYRPPSMNYKTFVDELEISFTLCTSISDNIFCLGDININMLARTSPFTKYFMEFLECLNLCQHISDPTRITQSSESLIDVIISTSPSLVISSGIEMNSESDHELVYCIINVDLPKETPIIKSYRDFKNLNMEEFTNDFQLLPLQQIYYVNDVNLKLDILNSNIIQLFDKHAPRRTINITKKHAPWLTDTIKLMMKLRDKAKLKFKRTKKVNHWQYYKSLRNLTNRSIISEKKAYFSYKTQNCNTKQIWKEFNQLHIKKSSPPEIPDHLCNPNSINNFFIDNIPKLPVDNETYNFYMNNINQNIEFTFETVTQVEICHYLNDIKSNAVGDDGINIEMVKLCGPLILNYLTHIINYCLTENVFPDSWKKAIITPLPKTNNPVNFSDLRPISILPTVSKVLEKIMNYQIRRYLDSHNLLPQTQSGFRQSYSCTTALLNITDDILEATDNGKSTALVLLDYSKAFDTIDHELLFAVLYHLGFSNNAVQLFKNYFYKRSQRVKVQSNFSESRQITQGVPQGSILGPLLYTIYTSNFCKFIKYSSIHMYADDTQIYCSFLPSDYDEALDKLTFDLNQLYQISHKHALKLNPSKSCVLLFGRNVDVLKDQLQLKIQGTVIPVKENAINLGLNLDNSFRYKYHVNKSIQKAYSNLKLLYPHRTYLNKTQKKCCAKHLSYHSLHTVLKYMRPASIMIHLTEYNGYKTPVCATFMVFENMTTFHIH